MLQKAPKVVQKAPKVVQKGTKSGSRNAFLAKRRTLVFVRQYNVFNDFWVPGDSKGLKKRPPKQGQRKKRKNPTRKHQKRPKSAPKRRKNAVECASRAHEGRRKRKKV